MTLYVLAVAVQSFAWTPGRLPLPLGVVLALVPMVPAVWAMGGWLAMVRALDELQKRLHAEAGLFALAVVAIVTFSYGFLEAALSAPRVSMFFVWPLVCLAYGVGFALARRRYLAPEA